MMDFRLTEQQRELQDAARTFARKELPDLAREMEDKPCIAMALNNLAELALTQGDHKAGRALQEQILTITREMGGKLGIAIILGNMANAAATQGDLIASHPLFAESLTLASGLLTALGWYACHPK